ncbi:MULTISPECIES: hypothetical protein [Tenacibaculum]|uniref:Uncharacterized protein n=1 Tax=Tenacibaculum singaporense TaxID=2358479 RepID=A0A3S8R286_9FLAO|nr:MULTISPECIES: hypothetical protein [Tenacibaculum]AZJ34004.1 hypothetical protein D6T69_00060 [Tenacibaculum singaporense]RLK07022.1 hypothetical protein C8N27_0593 [Tenacibaculum discolor]
MALPHIERRNAIIKERIENIKKGIPIPLENIDLHQTSKVKRGASVEGHRIPKQKKVPNAKNGKPPKST